MRADDLSERKKQILKAVVEAHISYGEPVGSKYLALSDQLACSSATIRNEMAELKALGYLEQPHTSAGSIPTELGYRFYVNALLERYNMTQNELRQINANLNRKLSELDQILAEASRLASAFTNYPSIAAKPRSSGITIDRFEGIYIDERTFALVMIFGGGAVRTKRLRTAFPLMEGELALLESVLNRTLVGKTAEQITLPVILELERAMGVASPVVNPLVKVIYETMQEFDAGDLRVEGVNRLLSIPDYSDMGELRGLIDLFERKDDLLSVISDAASDDIHVLIGHENSVAGMGNSALVYRTIRAGDRVLGAIGVIGPRRMDYSKVISIIDSLVHGIDSLLSGDDQDEPK